MANQTNNSMASGDPYCPVHGFTPCRCWQFQSQQYSTCKGCGKHVGFCMCSATSNPWADLVQQHNISLRDLTGTLPEDVQICQDVTKPQEEKPVKKWADELRETAQKVQDAREVEGRSAYYFFLERAKLSAKKGNFSVTFWASKLPWNREELDMAAELLRADNFKVIIRVAEDLREVDTEIMIQW